MMGFGAAARACSSCATRSAESM